MKNITSKKILTIALTLFCSWGILYAAEFRPLLDRSKVLQAAKNVDSQKYPDANTVLLSDYEKIKYNSDGTAVTVDEYYEKILTEKGKRDSRVLSLFYTLPYSRIDLLVLEIFKPDGKVVKLPTEKISKVMVNPSQMGSNIYNPNSKILKAAIPGLEVGDVVRVAYRRRVVHPRVRGMWCNFFVMEGNFPIVSYTVEINGPASKPLQRIMLKDPVKGTVKYSEKKIKDRIIYKWTARNVPQIFQEPDMPPYYMYTQRLLVSTARDWKDISEWYWNLCKPHLDKVTPEIKKKVAELTKGLKTENEKMEAIFQFVSTKIRYMGITTEKDAPGYEPHDVDITFNNRYGVCRDKAALLAAMLRVAGIKAYPVLFYVGPKKDPEVPNNFFNHAICCAELKKGEYTLMDPTDENTAKLFPAYLADKSYVVAKPNGEKLMTSSVIPAEDNLMVINTVCSVGSDLSLSGKTTMKFQGINDGVYRGAFARWRQDERQQFFARALKSIIPGAEIKSLKITPANLFNMKEQIKVVMTYSAPNWLIAGKKVSLLPLPWFGSRFGVVSFVLRGTGLNKRRFPLKIYSTCGVNERFELKLPVGMAVDKLPQYGTFASPEIAWRQTVAGKHGAVSGKYSFLIKTMKFEPAQYLELKKILKKIEYAKRKMPVLGQNMADEYNGADAVVLRDDTVISIKSSTSWNEKRTIEKKILNYAGMKSNSELRIHYNPAWEKITKLTGEVTSLGGSKKVLGKKEINLMDAGWTGSAPRYSPGKIMVASFPGVKPGSVIKYTIEKDYFNQPFFSDQVLFRGYDPIVSKKFIVKCPESMKLSVRNNLIDNSGFKYSVNNSNGMRTYEWTAENVKQVDAEPSTPPLGTFVPGTELSSIGWDAFRDMVREAFDKAANNQPQAAKIAEKLADSVNSGNKWEIVKKIRDYVAVNIRAAGPGFNGLPFSQLTPADKTLADGYGNTADRAILLTAMLRSVGCNAEPVPFSVYDTCMLENNTEPGLYFDPVLVRVSVKPGFFNWSRWFGKSDFRSNGLGMDSSIYLNDTSQYAELGTWDHQWKRPLYGSVGKELSNNYFICSYTIDLQKYGNAEITRKCDYYGTYFEQNNQMFVEMTPEKRSRYFQNAVARISQAAIPVGSLKTDFNKYPGIESFTVKVPQFAVREGKYLYFKLPGNILASLLRIGGKERKNPYYTGGSMSLAVKYDIILPKGSKELQMCPAEKSYRLPGSQTMLQVKVGKRKNAKGRQVVCLAFEIARSPQIVKPEYYAQLKKLNAEITNQAMRTLMIEMAPCRQ
jgi:transglutaminase-like putative cysteine protease